jgi:anti-sigma regulatory factor (Ser/Thr protein kinase)
MQDPRYVPPEGIQTTPRRRPPAAASAGITLPRAASAVSEARQYVTSALPDLCVRPDAVEDAELITSELVTNAFRHGRKGAVRLLIDLRDGTLTLTVADQTPYLPLPSAAPATDRDESGRGLFLVEALAEKWGHRPVAGNPACGTAVWATLAEVLA